MHHISYMHYKQCLQYTIYAIYYITLLAIYAIADICNSMIVQSGHPLIKYYESLYLQFLIFALHVISHICNMLRYATNNYD